MGGQFAADSVERILETSRSSRNEFAHHCRGVDMATSLSTPIDSSTTDTFDDGVFWPGSDGPDRSWAEPDSYPRLFTISNGFAREKVLCADEPEQPEYVTVPRHLCRRPESLMPIADWNSLWEAAQFRRRLFDPEDLPGPVWKIAKSGDRNVIFLPRTRSRYYEYAPLFHLLPRSVVERHNLPLIRAGNWPHTVGNRLVEEQLPADFSQRLADAWADLIWRDLVSGSPMSGFSSDDPIRILSHNLDFWVPAVTQVIHEILWEFPRAGGDYESERARLTDGTLMGGASVAAARMGGDLWHGDEDARLTASWVVDQADSDGRVRGILDAVRSNRVVDDFSDRWSHARTDFERKLHRTRNKIKVKFVELEDNICVHGPEADLVGNTIANDFMALLNKRDREIVVLLNSGHTKLTDVGEILGYSSHSGVSKRLDKIRQQAATYFDNV